MEVVMTQHIVMTPGTCGGRPRIDGTRIRVIDVATWYYHQRMTIDEILEGWPYLTEGQLFAALSFYHDNREMIDERQRQDDEYVERLIAEGKLKPALPQDVRDEIQRRTSTT